MTESYLGEIKMVGFNYAPNGWLQCNGQSLNINEFTSLYSLLGTTYGGDGLTTFQIPNLNNKIPIGQVKDNTNSNLGEQQMLNINSNIIPTIINTIPSQKISFNLLNSNIISE